MNDYLVFNEDESYQMNSNPRNPLGSFGKSSVSFSLSSLISILFSIGTAEIRSSNAVAHKYFPNLVRSTEGRKLNERSKVAE